MKTIIIEDEINAFEYLKSILKKSRPNAQVIEHLESVEDTVNWLHQNKQPDLIFLDIQLSDGLSFEIFNHVEVQCPIIFTTAFDQYAIDAFKVNSIDYLLKPIHIEDLEKALQKYELQQKRMIPANLSEQLNKVFKQLKTPKKNRCLIKKGNHFEFISIDDIAYAHSESSMTFLHTFNGKRHLYSNSVEGLIASLNEKVFFQINRGQIVNINAIEKIHPYFNQRLKLELTPPFQNEEIIVSRPRVGQFKDWLDV